MSESTAAAPAVSTSGDRVGRAPGVAVAAQALAAFVLGCVSTYVVVQTSPEFAFGLPFGVDVALVAPELVALLTIGLVLVPVLRPFGWLLAAAGLFGNALLYAQGTRLDGETLLMLVIIVVGAQFGGLLHVFALADVPARWAVGLGFAAGAAGGGQLLGIVAHAVHDDAAVFAVLSALVAVVGVALLVLRGRSVPAGAGRAPWWAMLGVVVAGVLAVAAMRAWDAALGAITTDYIGGISEADAARIQTWDQLARVGAALLVAAVLAVTAHRWGPRGSARWVAVGLAIALAGVGVNYFFAYEPGWTGVLGGVVGAAVGVPLVRALNRVPWDAVGLALATGLLLFDPPSPVSAVGWFGLGLAACAGLLRFASPAVGAEAGVGLGLGVASWVLCYQVVAPAAQLTDPFRPSSVPVLAIGVGVAALAAAVGFVLDHRAAQRNTAAEPRGGEPRAASSAAAQRNVAA